MFENLNSETTLVMLSTTTPNDQLGITFKFQTDRINTIEQLYTLSIPGRIREGQHRNKQHDAIISETPQAESQDGLRRSTIYYQEDLSDKDPHMNESARLDRGHEGTIDRRWPTFMGTLASIASMAGHHSNSYYLSSSKTTTKCFQ